MKTAPIREKLVVLALALVTVSSIFTAGVPIATSSSITFSDAEGWWDSAWGYRVPITITEQSGKDLTDYQILIKLDTASLIAAGKLRADAGDLRFVTPQGIELPYWIESGVGTALTKVWVKVPPITANGIATIYIYHGNPSATSAENGEDVFEFFDDFLISTWTDSRGGWATTTFDGRSVLQSGARPWQYSYTMNQQTGKYVGDMGENWAVEMCTYWDSPGGTYGRYWSIASTDIGADKPAGSGYVGLSSELYWGFSNEHRIARSPWPWGEENFMGEWEWDWAIPSGAPNKNVWARQTFKKFGGKISYTDAITVTVEDPSPLTTFKFLDFHHNCEGSGAEGKLNIDWVFVRKHVEPEPAISTKAITTLMVEPSIFAMEPGGSKTLTVTLISNGTPLAGKTVTWSASAGSVTPLNTTTNLVGKVSVTYTGPSSEAVGVITASFAGDDLYWPSTSTSQATIVYTFPLEAVIDIKPETLRIGSMGNWVTCYIELPSGDVDQIDVSSILLEGTIPVDTTAPTEIGDYDSDGVSDLTVKFDRLSVENIVVPGLVTLTVTGDANGSSFAGSDTIDVIRTPPTSQPPSALISVRRATPHVEPTVNTEVYSFSLDLSAEVSEQLVEVTLDSESSKGQTIILNIDNNVLTFGDLDEIEVLFDNHEIGMASSYEDILNPNDESEAEYVILLGSEGVQLLVSIPHFSAHTISVGTAGAPYQPPATPAEGIPPAAILAVVCVALLVAISAAWVGLRQARGDATSELMEHGLSGMSLREADIFREIRERGEFTIPEVILKTGASKTITWRAVQKLIEKGLVEPTGEVKSPAAGRGKPSAVYRYVGGR